MSGHYTEIVRSIFDRGWSTGDFAGLEAFLEGPFTFHVRGESTRMTLGDLVDIVERWREGFPDLSFEITDLVEEGDRVAMRARLVGTNTGNWGERRPTGRSIEVEHAFFFRFDGDRIVEVFEFLDVEALREQLGS